MYRHSKEDQSVEIVNEEESLFDNKDGLQYELSKIKTEIEDIKKSTKMFEDKIASLQSNFTKSKAKYDQDKKEMGYAKTKHDDLIKQETITSQTQKQVSANISDAINESAVLKMEQAQIDEEHQQLQEQYNDLAQQQQTLQYQLNVLKSEEKSLNGKDPRLDKLKEEIENLN